MIVQLHCCHDRPLWCASNKLHRLSYCCLVTELTDVQSSALAALRSQTCVVKWLLDSAVHVVTESLILGTTLASLAVDMANATIASCFEERSFNAGL